MRHQVGLAPWMGASLGVTLSTSIQIIAQPVAAAAQAAQGQTAHSLTPTARPALQAGRALFRASAAHRQNMDKAGAAVLIQGIVDQKRMLRPTPATVETAGTLAPLARGLMAVVGRS